MRDGLKRSLEELQKSGKTEERLCPICFEADVLDGKAEAAGSMFETSAIFQPDCGHRFCDSCTLKTFK